MKHRLFLISLLSVGMFVASGHFFARAYFQNRQLAAQAEIMTVRTRLMRQQIGELEQKMRVIQRVNHFVEHAGQLKLTPEQWTRYDVNVEDALTFRELSRMIEQCVHNKDLYYKPLAFQVTLGGQERSPQDGEAGSASTSRRTSNQLPTELKLNLKGAFFVRQP